MEPVWLFDFAEYLSQLDPTQSYCINRLSGGLINETVRAAKNNESITSSEGRFSAHNSLILKYAPPYVAALGEGAPFSQSRQAVEAAALSLFAKPDGPLSSLATTTSVRIPRLLSHDSDAKILVLSDLGRLSDLTSYIVIPPVYPLPQLDGSIGKIIGERLGHFFSLLHSRKTCDLVRQHSAVFNEPDLSARALIFEVTVEPIPGYLSNHGVSETEAKELYRRVKEDFFHVESDEESSFILGDAWTGAVLLDPLPDDPTVAVIDWEFAGFGRGVAGDVAQLLAHLHLALLSAQATRSYHTVVVEEMIDSFTRTYRKCSKQSEAFWTAGLDHLVVARTIRSTFLLHGREMVNNANEREWACTCCGEESESNKQRSAENRCRLRSQMVETGIGSLRIAGTSEQEFLKKIRTGEVRLQDAGVLKYLWE